MLLNDLYDDTWIFERSAQDKILAAVTDFYRKNTNLTPPDDYEKSAQELVAKADPKLRGKIANILDKAKKDPYMQGGVITTIGALLAGGVLSAASNFHLSPAQTNIALQAILNTVIPTLVSRINGKNWRDTLKYTLASVTVGTGIAGLASMESKALDEESNTRFEVTYDIYGSNRNKPLYTNSRIVKADSEQEAIAIIRKLIGGTNHRAKKLGLEEGPVWDRVKRTAAAGAVATGLGYAALTGQGAEKAPEPTKEPIVTTQQVTKAPEPSKAVEPTKDSTMVKADSKMQNMLFGQATKAGLRGDELAQFMAQAAHESVGFTELTELGSKDYFRQYDIKHNPDKARALGNLKPGDGIRYKGRGFLQITGRENYRMAGKALGLPLEKHPELAERPDIAAKIALWFWKSRVRPGIENWADTIGVTQKINPGMQGLGDRDANFHRYAGILKVASR